MKFDATWWGTALSDEQQGFIYGNQDCRQPLHAKTGSVDDYQNYITKYLSAKAEQQTSVSAAIQVAEMKMPARRVLPGGEVWAGPHGFLDGGWWGLPNINDSYQQIGYVEGYLVCLKESVTPKRVQSLVARINRHYALPHSEHDSIAVVLRRALKMA